MSSFISRAYCITFLYLHVVSIHYFVCACVRACHPYYSVCVISHRLSSNSNSSSSYSNHRDDNYHDYMNADALSNTTASPPGHSPLYQGPGQPSPPISQPQDPSPSPQQDQRLLSVSGKKKCSHCSEELGQSGVFVYRDIRSSLPFVMFCVQWFLTGQGTVMIFENQRCLNT